MKFLRVKHHASEVVTLPVIRRKKTSKTEFSSDDVVRAAKAGDAHFQYFVATGKLPVSK